MIDPNILLQAKPVDIETPLQAQQQVAQVQNLQNVGSLQKLQMTAADQENQQRQIQLDNQRAIDDAVQKNVRLGDDGHPYIDHSGVVGTLTQMGKGNAAIAYQQHATELQKGLLALSEAQQKINYEKQQHLGSMAGAVLDAPAESRPYLYTQARQLALANHYATPDQLPEEYSPQVDSVLGTVRDSAMSAKDQGELRNSADRAQASQDRARASEDRARDADQRTKDAEDRAAAGVWKPNGSRNGKALYFNPATGEEKVGGPIDLTESSGARLTPDASLADKRANQKDYETSAAGEIKARQDKQALQSALQGSVYVDDKGKVTPFSSMKQSNGEPLTADDIKAYRDEMTRRLGTAQTAIETFVANKNNAMQRNGVQPQVSTQQAIAAYRGQDSEPNKNSATRATPTYLKFAVDGKGNRIGYNAASKQWEPISSK